MEEENTGNIAIRVVREMRQGGAVHVVIHIISLKEKKKAVQTGCSGEQGPGSWLTGLWAPEHWPGKAPPIPEHIRREGTVFLFSS